MRLDGAERQTLTDRGNNRLPVWSPDGRWITFCSARDGNPEIYKVAAQ